ncbi:hypothetical protein G9A89_010523 [Geosiphon pyriformis]|nr:hypothetical protein G9A89_010523 [Geosiphon pyriformis]
MGPMMMATTFDSESQQTQTQTQAQIQNQQPQPQSNGSSNHSRHSSISSNNTCDDPELQALTDLERQLEKLINTFWKAAVNMCDTTDDKANFSDNFPEILKELNLVDEFNDRITTQVPIEALESLDKGENPENLITDYLKSVMDQETLMREKTQSIQDLYEALSDALDRGLNETSSALRSNAESSHSNGF